MTFTVFYAWQSDNSPSLNRWFIQDAIKAAIKQLKAEFIKEVDDLKLEPAPAVDAEEKQTDPDANTEDDEIILQVGAAGGSGAPLIAETILERITDCGVFVGDVSFVTKFITTDGREKLVPNSNVLIETGAAARTGSRWNRMVLVLNTASGPVDQLPFDLKHRTCRIQYELSDSKDPEKANKRRLLTKDLFEQIRMIYRNAMARQSAAEEQTTANTTREGLVRAGAERKYFEQRIIDNKFYDFRAQCAILTVTLTPMKLPSPSLNFSKIDESVLLGYIQPFGIYDSFPRHQPKSVICGGTRGVVPISLVELTSTGSIFACYNFKYGQDNATPGLAKPPKVDPSKPYPVSMQNYQPHLIEGVRRFLKGLTKLGIVGPWFLSLSLLKARNCHLVIGGDYHFVREGGGCEVDDICTEAIAIPSDLNLEDREAVASAMAEPLRELWRSCAYRTFPMFRPDGSVDWSH